MVRKRRWRVDILGSDGQHLRSVDRAAVTYSGVVSDGAISESDIATINENTTSLQAMETQGLN